MSLAVESTEDDYAGGLIVADSSGLMEAESLDDGSLPICDEEMLSSDDVIDYKEETCDDSLPVVLSDGFVKDNLADELDRDHKPVKQSPALPFTANFRNGEITSARNKCLICGRYLNGVFHYERHTKMHDATRPFKCEYDCIEFYFMTRDQRVKHYSKYHRHEHKIRRESSGVLSPLHDDFPFKADDLDERAGDVPVLKVGHTLYTVLIL